MSLFKGLTAAATAIGLIAITLLAPPGHSQEARRAGEPGSGVYYEYPKQFHGQWCRVRAEKYDVIVYRRITPGQRNNNQAHGCRHSNAHAMDISAQEFKWYTGNGEEPETCKINSAIETTHDYMVSSRCAIKWPDHEPIRNLPPYQGHNYPYPEPEVIGQRWKLESNGLLKVMNGSRYH